MTQSAVPLTRPSIGERARARVELIEPVLLIGLAAAIRWPDCLYQPGFTDEALEVTRAALIAQGRLQSVTNVTPFISSLFNELLAGAFVLLGPRIELPRLFMLATGALTVGAVYLLAREWGGRLAGCLAALLLATNATHILVNSRIAYSNCMTPLFTTLALWQLTRAVRRRGTGEVETALTPTLSRARERGSAPAVSLCLAAVLFGLALMTHPSVLTLLPACVVWFLWQGGELRRTRWPWVAAGLFLLVCSPLIVYNLVTGFDSISGLEHTGTMDRSKGFGPPVYLDNLANYALMLLRTTAGQLERRGGPLAYLMDPVGLLWLGLGLAAIAILARRGNGLLAVLVPGSLMVAALFSANSFEPVQPGRYVMPTVVALLAGVATVLADLAVREKGRKRDGAHRSLRVSISPSLRLSVSLALFLALVVPSLLAFAGYEDRRVVDNRALIGVLETIEASRQPDEPILLDHQLTLRRWGSGAVPSWIVDMLLTIRRIPFVETEAEPEAVAYLLGGRPSALIVLDDDSVARLRDRYTLTRLALLTNKPARNDQPNKHALYRLNVRG